MLKTQSMVKARAYFHENYADNVIMRIAETGTLHQTDVLEGLREFEPHVRPVEPSERLFRTTSIISRIQTMIEALNLNPQKLGKGDIRVISDKEIDEIDQELSSLEQRYSSIISKSTLPNEEEAAVAEQAASGERQQQLSEVAGNYEERLLRWNRQLEIVRLVEEAKSRGARTSKTFVVEGWIPRGKVAEFEEAVREGSKDCCATLCASPPIEKGTHSEHIEAPPTMIRNPRIAYVYEKLVTGFGLPNYFEVDPTVFMLFSFPIIFGLMFADVGHGLILLVLSLLLVAVNRRRIKAPELFDYMIKGSPLLVMCSISAVFFGLIEGELFGSEEYYHVIDESLHKTFGISILETVRSTSHNVESILSAIAGFSIPIPFPFSPFEKPMALLLVSLYVAIIQITFGLVLGFVNQLRRRNYLEAIVGPGLWLWFYSSCAYLFLKYKSGILSIVFQRGDILGLYIALPAAVMILARTAVHGLDGFGHSLESLISSLSNSISYGRILALALTHGAFSRILLMFLGLQGTVFAVVGGVMWGVLTFLLILCFEGLLSFIQTLRLHWVEWFLKFYSGDGYEYKPLRF